MIKKIFGCFLLFIMVPGLLSGCGLFNSFDNSACYWEKKVRHNLPTTLSQSSSSTAAHFEQKQIISPLDFGDKLFGQSSSPIDFDGDIYIAGRAYISPNNAACYWKNGEITMLPGGDSANNIFVDGNNVYVVGSYIVNPDEISGVSKYQACYWKNGDRITLVDGTTASEICVKNNNIYILGKYVENPDNPIVSYPVYWVNGVRRRIDGFEANDMYVDGNDIYFAGSYGSFCDTKACYWKNNVRYPLDNFWATGITVKDSVVYVCGGGPGDSKCPFDIAVDGSDVYTVGSYWITNDDGSLRGGGPCYWKNEELVPFGDFGDQARYIFISGHNTFISNSVGMFWVNGQPVDLNANNPPNAPSFCPYGIFAVQNSI